MCYICGNQSDSKACLLSAPQYIVMPLQPGTNRFCLIKLKVS